MQQTTSCAVCGKHFQKITALSRYCSIACRNRRVRVARRRRFVKQCARCDVSYETEWRHQRYCSLGCRPQGFQVYRRHLWGRSVAVVYSSCLFCRRLRAGRAATKPCRHWRCLSQARGAVVTCERCSADIPQDRVHNGYRHCSTECKRLTQPVKQMRVLWCQLPRYSAGNSVLFS